MFFRVFPFIMAMWLIVRVALPCRMKRRGAVFAFVLVALSMKFYIYRLISGDFFNPDLPVTVLYVCEWLYASCVILFLTVLVCDVAALCFLGVRMLWKRASSGGSDYSQKIYRSRRKVLLMIISSLILGGIGMYEAFRVPNVRSVEAEVADLPESLDGLTVVQLTDLHIDILRGASWMSDVVDKINALNPDVVVFTGDLVDGAPDRHLKSFVALKKIHSRYGVYGCVGNHEYYSGLKPWIEEWSNLGIRMLLNEGITRYIDDSALTIIGVTDTAAQRFGGVLPDIDSTLAMTRIHKTAMADTCKPDKSISSCKQLTLLLSHRPSNAAEYAKAGINVQLSGHTHGGLLVPLQWLIAGYNGGYVSGMYNVGGMTLYVSNGAGLWSGFAVRLGVPSEITLLRFKRK